MKSTVRINRGTDRRTADERTDRQTGRQTGRQTDSGKTQQGKPVGHPGVCRSPCGYLNTKGLGRHHPVRSYSQHARVTGGGGDFSNVTLALEADGDH